MQCSTCGATLPGDAGFCPACGARLAAPGAAAQPPAPPEGGAPQAGWQPNTSTNPPGPRPAQTTYGSGGPTGVAPLPGQPSPASPAPPPQRKSWLPAVLIAAAGAVLALALVLYFVFLHPLDPKKALRKALQNTQDTLAAERRDTADALGFEAAMAALSEGPAAVEMGFEMDVPELGGRLSAATTLHADAPNQRVEGEASVGMGTAALLRLEYGVDGDLFAFSVPELAAGSYGFNTATLGRDLQNSPIGDMLGQPVDEDFSFHIFGEANAEPEEAPALLGEDFDAMWRQVKVTRGDKVDADINGSVLRCQVYTVAIPREALRSYAEMLQQALPDEDRLATLNELMAKMAPDAPTDPGALMDEWMARLDGDAECRMYVHQRAVLKMELDLPDTRLHLSLGGGQYLTDAVTLKAWQDDAETLYLSATGQVAAPHGQYQNHLALRAGGAGFEADVAYRPSEALDNLEINATAEGVRFSLAGTLAVEGQTLSADLYDIRLESGGQTLTMAANWASGPEDAYGFEPLAPTMLLEMSQAELGELLMEIIGGGSASMADFL